MVTPTDAPGGLVGWWRRRGIQARSTIVATGVVALATVVGGVLLLAALSVGIQASVRSATMLRAEDFAAQVATDDKDAVSAAIDSQSDDGTLLQIVDASGTVVAASPALAGYPPLAPAGTAAGSRATYVVDSGMPDPGPYVVAVTTTSTPGGLVTVIAAASLEQRDRTVGLVRSALLLGAPLLLLTVGVATWVSVGRSLASVDRIRDQVEAIEAGTLSVRVPVPEPDDGVRRLAVTMNEMLDRIEASMEEQRRFVADASHELKSPLASMKTTVDVARRVHGQVDGPAVDALEHEIDRMSELVTDLLLLARADEGLMGRALQDVDLDEIVLAEVARLRAATSLTVSADVEAVRVRGDGSALARVVRNLADNGARYASSRLRFSIRRDGDVVAVVCEDDGPGIPPDSRSVVFDRFVRLDEHRSRDHGGTGLGLAIVRDVVVAHGGEVVADASDLGGARFTLRLPAPQPLDVDPA